VDSPFLPRDAREWADRIRQLTGREIAYQINTDHHFDHVIGNTFLTDKVITHATAARGLSFLRDKKVLREAVLITFPDTDEDSLRDIDDLQIPAPLITFNRSLTLDMGDATIILEFLGGHSPGTILTYLKEDRAVFTGDNVEALFPAFGEARFNAWIQALEKMLSMDIDLVVPGHGPVGGKELIERFRAFFQSIHGEVKGFARNGFTPEQMLEQSTVIDFFSMEEMKKEGITRNWLGDQYKRAAMLILAEEKET